MAAAECAICTGTRQGLVKVCATTQCNVVVHTTCLDKWFAHHNHYTCLCSQRLRHTEAGMLAIQHPLPPPPLPAAVASSIPPSIGLTYMYATGLFLLSLCLALGFICQPWRLAPAMACGAWLDASQSYLWSLLVVYWLLGASVHLGLAIVYGCGYNSAIP